MSEEKKAVNAEGEYVEYCKRWFGVDVDPKEQFVTLEQWKMYRLSRSHAYYRINYYFFVVISLIFLFLYLWSAIL